MPPIPITFPDSVSGELHDSNNMPKEHYREEAQMSVGQMSYWANVRGAGLMSGGQLSGYHTGEVPTCRQSVIGLVPELLDAGDTEELHEPTSVVGQTL